MSDLKEIHTKARHLFERMEDFMADMKEKKLELEGNDESSDGDISILREQILDFGDSVSAFEETLRALS